MMHPPGIAQECSVLLARQGFATPLLSSRPWLDLKPSKELDKHGTIACMPPIHPHIHAIQKPLKVSLDTQREYSEASIFLHELWNQSGQSGKELNSSMGFR